jgi:hypothetical protein
LGVRRSILWKEPKDEQLVSLFHSCQSLNEIFNFVGVKKNKYNYALLRERCEGLGLDYEAKVKQSLFLTGKNAPKMLNRTSWTPLNPDEVLVSDSKVKRISIRRIVLRENLVPYVCASCGNTGEWHDKPLVLDLDHINGQGDDNRVENLRFLCPNCHSQTPTYRMPRKRRK